jgi:hypothetical protein
MTVNVNCGKKRQGQHLREVSKTTENRQSTQVHLRHKPQFWNK